MKCARCGGEILEGNACCPSCGLKIKIGQPGSGFPTPGAPALPPQPSQQAGPGPYPPHYASPTTPLPPGEVMYDPRLFGMERPARRTRRRTPTMRAIAIACVILVAVSAGVALLLLDQPWRSGGTMVSALTVLHQAEKSMSSVTSVKLHANMTGNASGQNLNGNSEVEEEKTPEGIKMKMTSVSSGQEMDMYVVGGLFYWHILGKWWKSSSSISSLNETNGLMGGTGLGVTIEDIQKSIGQAKSPKFVAQDSNSYTVAYQLNADYVKHMQAAESAPGENNTVPDNFIENITVKVSKATKLVTRIDSQIGGGTQGKSNYISMKSTTSLEYNVPINFQVPAEALNAPEMQNGETDTTSNIEKFAGVYSSSDMNLALDSDGSVTLDMPSEPHPILGRGGSFSCDGKEIKIKFPEDKNVMTFKVAGDNLVGISPGVEGKILKRVF